MRSIEKNMFISQSDMKYLKLCLKLFETDLPCVYQLMAVRAQISYFLMIDMYRTFSQQNDRLSGLFVGAHSFQL